MPMNLEDLRKQHPNKTDDELVQFLMNIIAERDKELEERDKELEKRNKELKFIEENQQINYQTSLKKIFTEGLPAIQSTTDAHVNRNHSDATVVVDFANKMDFRTLTKMEVPCY
jgi:hypothetical protein